MFCVILIQSKETGSITLCCNIVKNDEILFLLENKKELPVLEFIFLLSYLLIFLCSKNQMSEKKNQYFKCTQKRPIFQVYPKIDQN